MNYSSITSGYSAPKTNSPPLANVVASMKYTELVGLKVSFINMPLRENAAPNTPPQGPALMADRLRKYGAIPSIIDLNAYRIKDDQAEREGKSEIGRHLNLNEAEQLISATFEKHGEPDLIGLSGMITTLKWQSDVVTMCRKLCRDAFIVSGGGLATELTSALFEWIPQLDAISHSEGDDIILYEDENH